MAGIYNRLRKDARSEAAPRVGRPRRVVRGRTRSNAQVAAAWANQVAAGPTTRMPLRSSIGLALSGRLAESPLSRSSVAAYQFILLCTTLGRSRRVGGRDSRDVRTQTGRHTARDGGGAKLETIEIHSEGRLADCDG